MSKRKTIDDKYVTSDGFAYLTKRTLVGKAQAEGRKAAKRAMGVMGYVVTQQANQIIKRYEDGRIEILEEIQKIELPQNLQLG